MSLTWQSKTIWEGHSHLHLGYDFDNEKKQAPLFILMNPFKLAIGTSFLVCGFHWNIRSIATLENLQTNNLCSTHQYFNKHGSLLIFTVPLCCNRRLAPNHTQIGSATKQDPRCRNTSSANLFHVVN